MISCIAILIGCPEKFIGYVGVVCVSVPGEMMAKGRTLSAIGFTPTESWDSDG